MDRDELNDLREPEYDIQLRDEPPQTLTRAFPRARTFRTPPQTALVGRVRDVTQFDTLLDRLQSVGLVIDEIHRHHGPSTEPGDEAAIYEVRVEGCLGPSMLGYLKWRHYMVPGRTRVRIAADSAELLQCLEMFTDAGTGVERVRRVAPPRPRRTDWG